MSFDLFKYDKHQEPSKYIEHMKKIRDCAREILLEYTANGRLPSVDFLCDDVMERLKVEVTVSKDGTNNYLIIKSYIKPEVKKAKEHFSENKESIISDKGQIKLFF